MTDYAFWGAMLIPLAMVAFLITDILISEAAAFGSWALIVSISVQFYLKADTDSKIRQSLADKKTGEETK
jgi:hypothetical protein